MFWPNGSPQNIQRPLALLSAISSAEKVQLGFPNRGLGLVFGAKAWVDELPWLVDSLKGIKGLGNLFVVLFGLEAS